MLDATPGSTRGREDCAIVVGRTYGDPQACLFITPVAKGGSGADEWIDVVVNFGNDPANQPPTVAVSSDVNSAAVGAVINFTADATDADGDPLAYHWEFGDDAFGNNAASVAHNYSAAGKYVVRCTVKALIMKAREHWFTV